MELTNLVEITASTTIIVYQLSNTYFPKNQKTFDTLKDPRK